mmetsp:Transcript_30877/g.118394  ORF Transcript_30877/g.118394 Transcript_30877/m.118394 type:complete len:219 (-) Transcript_30877:367-1023(-)|eukprot:CAMPEP_0113961432 /NCGR_PEP_ID=MMETSP0011_2-20120614/5304_1 /TAXON_ID=101924 /ORGANISM="Rhodosorus marinus" /LENGTH=218 /DNA_ID=CAMNT_0000973069 /DNA_START=2753 /DNA_END=3409 /DNA_ORIENTATION=+ /assembly_acc=CAM_ASM_000156
MPRTSAPKKTNAIVITRNNLAQLIKSIGHNRLSPQDISILSQFGNSIIASFRCPPIPKVRTVHEPLHMISRASAVVATSPRERGLQAFGGGTICFQPCFPEYPAIRRQFGYHNVSREPVAVHEDVQVFNFNDSTENANGQSPLQVSIWVELHEIMIIGKNGPVAECPDTLRIVIFMHNIGRGPDQLSSGIELSNRALNEIIYALVSVQFTRGFRHALL